MLDSVQVGIFKIFTTLLNSVKAFLENIDVERSQNLARALPICDPKETTTWDIFEDSYITYIHKIRFLFSTNGEHFCANENALIKHWLNKPKKVSNLLFREFKMAVVEVPTRGRKRPLIFRFLRDGYGTKITNSLRRRSTDRPKSIDLIFFINTGRVIFEIARRKYVE